MLSKIENHGYRVSKLARETEELVPERGWVGGGGQRRGRNCPTHMCDAAVPSLVAQGDLFSARRVALESCWRTRSTVAPFAAAAQAMLDDDTGRLCAEQWTTAVDALLARPGYDSLVDTAHHAQ